MGNSIKETEETKLPLESIDRLLFRRQFILGPEGFELNEYWTTQELDHNLYLSSHHDLSCVTKKKGNITLTLLGTVIDPFNPSHDEMEILYSLLQKATDISEVIKLSKPLGGRWVIIFQNNESTFLFSDPCAFRQVFYCRNGDKAWCASQPELIKQKRKLTVRKDKALFDFLAGPEFGQRESAWLGNTTIYDQCFRLLPNHYLDLSKDEPVRFFPNQERKEKEVSDIVEAACSILKGTMKAITSRREVAMPLTAGWDSRVLLAASKELTQNIELYIDRQGVLKDGNPDIWTPNKLSKKLGLDFYIRNSSGEIPGWFVSLLAQNVTGARILSKTRAIYSKLVSGEERVNINGNGSEIARNFFDKKLNKNEQISPEKLVKIFGYKSAPSFAVEEVSKWYKEISKFLKGDLHLLDMFYWEQKMGSWGGQFPAEQDIAVEEISPFNCRLLIENLLLAPRDMRSAPNYELYELIIKELWPEVLSVPINPLPKLHINISNALRNEKPGEMILEKVKRPIKRLMAVLKL